MLTATVAVVAVAAVTTTLVIRSHRHSGARPRVKPDPAGALAHAREACSQMTLLESEVQANAAAKAVLATVAQARIAGGQAAAQDVRWISLESGIEAVQLGLRHDDAAAASVGIRTVRAQCQVVDQSATSTTTAGG